MDDSRLIEIYCLGLVPLLKKTGKIVRENVNDTNQFLVIFKNISFTDSSLNDLIDFENEQKKANKLKKIESYYLQAEKTLFVTLTL